MTLPTDDAERKGLPLWTFLMEYFPLAFLEVVRVAVDGDKQHKNEGGKIRWAREKSTDQLNTAMRHQFDYGTGQTHDKDGRAHLAKAIWRLSAQLQLDEEARLAALKPAFTREEWLAYVGVKARDALDIAGAGGEGSGKTLTDLAREVLPVLTRADAMRDIAVPRCTMREGGDVGPRCILTDGHPGGHKSAEEPPTFEPFANHLTPNAVIAAGMKAPNICPDCGVDLSESRHDPRCLRLNQHF